MDIMLILVVILVIVLVWRGPTMLPRLGESLGKTVKGFRDNLPGAANDDRGDSPGSDTSPRP